jgi:SPX domain protein involved in polyphosphate accumulation
MVKYGKLFRELQIKEFEGYYINYKRLKQKIKEIQKILPRIS